MLDAYIFSATYVGDLSATHVGRKQHVVSFASSNKPFGGRNGQTAPLEIQENSPKK